MNQHHPFNHAYHIQNSNDLNVIHQAHEWVCSMMGVTFPLVPILVVNHDHLQRSIQQITEPLPRGHVVYGCYSPVYRRVFISDRTKPSHNVRHCATVVHEIVHYFQDMLNLPYKSVEEYENEATSFEQRFIRNYCALCAKKY